MEADHFERRAVRCFKLGKRFGRFFTSYVETACPQFIQIETSNDPDFERLLKALSHRRPFLSYTVEFNSGESIEVDQPEALVTRGGVAVYLAADGTPAWFDHLGVSRVVGAVEQTPASGTKSTSA